MRSNSKRRGLSPLIATVLLISATVLGGVLVYQYFQNSFTNAKTLSQGVIVTAGAIPLSNDNVIVKITITNQRADSIIVQDIRLMDSGGEPLNATPVDGSSYSVSLQPGKKTTILLKTSGDPALVYIVYEANGEVYQSEPVQVAK